MIKKISHIILASILMVTTLGMTISIHYCGDDFKSVSFFNEANSCCEIPHGCCHDESISIKIENDFSAASYTFDFTQLAIVLPTAIELMKSETLDNNSPGIHPDTPPPPNLQQVLSSLQTYLL